MAQQNQATSFMIQGVVTDSISGEPLPFVHISWCGTEKGTVSNSRGMFQLAMPDAENLRGSLLCFSSIGYQARRYVVRFYKPGNQLIIGMMPAISLLNEVQVSNTGVQPEEILGRAIRRIKQNYLLKPFYIEAYYRDYLKNDSTYTHLREAAVGIFDEGFREKSDKSRVKIYQSRFSRGYPFSYRKYFENNIGGTLGNLSVFGGSELSVLLFNDPVRNAACTSFIAAGYNLTEDFLTYHDVDLHREFEHEGRSYYEFRIKANTRHPLFMELGTQAALRYRMEGQLYIDRLTMGIAGVKYTTYLNEAGRLLPVNSMQVRYRLQENKFVLAYLYFANHIRIDDVAHRGEFEHCRELFVQNVHTKNLPQAHHLLLFEEIEHQHSRFSDDPGFWERYGMNSIAPPWWPELREQN